MTEPEPTWRIRAGVGLVEHMPASAERRALIDREAEKERKAAEREAQQRRDAALERRWDLQRAGVEPHSVGDVLAAESFAADRQDRRDARIEREAAEDDAQAARRALPAYAISPTAEPFARLRRWFGR